MAGDIGEIGQNDQEIDLIPRIWGGWLAVAKNRNLAASGATVSEARAQLAEAIRKFDGWAEEWARERSPSGARQPVPVRDTMAGRVG